MRHKQVIDGSKPFRPMRLVHNQAATRDALHGVARAIVRKARRAINRGGRFGKSRADGQRASTKGEAPHTLTGELSASLKVRESGSMVQIGSTVEHARKHEFGGRPFLRPQIAPAMLQESDGLQHSVRLR